MKLRAGMSFLTTAGESKFVGRICSSVFGKDGDDSQEHCAAW